MMTSVLITGGAGTFGSALAKRLVKTCRVVVFSRGEHRQAALKADVPAVETWIGDVRDRDRLAWALRFRPDVVVHAAALKRIESCQENPREALLTNTMGTLNVVEAAMLAGVPKVLVVSSDKACSPETVYGATKAAAEAVAIGQNAWRGDGPTRISVARYGNVLGSQGSVLDALITARVTGEFQMTNPAATRFWWDAGAAVSFVLDTLGRMQGGEVWVPKLPSATMGALAASVAPSATITVVGMRGAEKVHESMIAASEATYTWDCGDRYVLLPYHGAWWSPAPPSGATRVPAGFTYTSGDDPSDVVFEEAS